MPMPVQSLFAPRGTTPSSTAPSRTSLVSGDPFGRLFDAELGGGRGTSASASRASDARASDARDSEARTDPASRRPRRTDSSRRRDDERIEPTVGTTARVADAPHTPQQISQAIDDLAGRIAGVVRAKVDQVAPGHELRVAVDAGALGIEEIAVRRTASGQIEVVFGKTGADAQDLLAKHLGELTQALERRQIDVGRLHLLSADGQDLRSYEPAHRTADGGEHGADSQSHGRDGRNGEQQDPRRSTPSSTPSSTSSSTSSSTPLWQGLPTATHFDRHVEAIEQAAADVATPESRP